MLAIEFGRKRAPLHIFLSNHDFHATFAPINWLSPNIPSHPLYLSFAECSWAQPCSGSLSSRGLHNRPLLEDVWRLLDTRQRFLSRLGVQKPAADLGSGNPRRNRK